MNSRVTAPARERIHRLVGSFGDPRIAVAPQERVADADANPSEVAGACSRDEAGRIDAGGVQRGKAVCDVADAAGQQVRRVEGRGQRHDAIGRPAAECDLQADRAGHARRNPHRARRVAAKGE